MTEQKMKQKRVALVTGGAGGIGWGISQALAADGFHVVVVDKSDQVEPRVKELKDRGFAAEGVTVDLMDLKQVQSLIDRMHATHGAVDVLVNNAGGHPRRPDGGKYDLAELPLEVWEATFRLNLVVPFLLCKGLVPLMAEKGWGRVINIASRAARTAITRVGAHYPASKTGLVGLTRSVAAEFSPKGVTANCIAPGRVVTALESLTSEEERIAARREMLVGRPGTIDEIGAAASFLASEKAAFITGIVLDANGGAWVG